MSRLLFDEVDLVKVGLIPSWADPPSWLIDILTRTVEANCGHLISECIRTHQACILYTMIQSLGLEDTLSDEHRSRLEEQRAICSIMQSVCISYAADIHYLLDQLNIPHAFLKSIITGVEYYNLEERTGKDVDVLMPREHIDMASRVLRELGFRHGYFDRNTNSVIHIDYSPPSDKHYEIPALWIDVPFETDFDIGAYVNANRSRRFYMRDGQPFVRLAVELHYGLGTACELQWGTRLVQHDLFMHPLPGLDLQTEIIYHAVKGYTDLCVLRQPRSLKLLADAVRAMQKYHPILDIPVMVHRVAAIKVQSPFWYLGRFMQDFLDWNWDEGVWHELEAPDTLDFGDFLPRIFSRRSSLSDLMITSLRKSAYHSG